MDLVPPGVAVLRRYDRSWLAGDALAGVAVAAYLIPQVMAYAEIAGVPAASGLAAACGALLVYAVFGSSRQLSMGPESTTALMTAVAVAPLAAGDPARYGTLAAALAVVVGVLCLVARLLRAGVLADLLSKPVLVGYLAGVAINMIGSQLGKVSGVDVDGDTVPAQLLSFAGGLGGASVPTVLLGAVLLLVLFVGSSLFPRWPVLLIAMLGAAAAVALFSLQDIGIAVLGAAAASPQAPALPLLGLDEWAALLLPAVGIAVVGYSDNMLTARSFAGHKNETVDGNTELVALGVGNVLVGLIRGFPVSSSGSRTSIGDAQGSRTQLHSVVAVAVVVLILVFGQSVLAAFPTAALGAVVIYAAVRLIDVAEFRYDAPLCFANAEDFRMSALAAVEASTRWFVLNAEANVELDTTAADALGSLIAELRRRGVVFAMARVKQDLRGELARAGLVDLVGEDRIYMTLPTAVAAYREWEAEA